MLYHISKHMANKKFNKIFKLRLSLVQTIVAFMRTTIVGLVLLFVRSGDI